VGSGPAGSWFELDSGDRYINSRHAASDRLTRLIRYQPRARISHRHAARVPDNLERAEPKAQAAQLLGRSVTTREAGGRTYSPIIHARPTKSSRIAAHNECSLLGRVQVSMEAPPPDPPDEIGENV